MMLPIYHICNTLDLKSGDYDYDYRAGINDKDDDNDSIPTIVEVQNHLGLFNPADAAGDLDNDGLSNLFEY